jgi:hypothetical protein
VGTQNKWDANQCHYDKTPSFHLYLSISDSSGKMTASPYGEMNLLAKQQQQKDISSLGSSCL